MLSPECGMRSAQTNQLARELQQIGIAHLPVHPRNLVVLTVRVVVAVLRAATLVAGDNHRYALRREKRRQHVALLPTAERVDRGVVGRSFGAAVPRSIMRFAVGVVVAIGLVVLLVVRNEIAQREAVVGGDEVDAGVRPAIAGVQIGAAGKPR